MANIHVIQLNNICWKSALYLSAERGFILIRPQKELTSYLQLSCTPINEIAVYFLIQNSKYLYLQTLSKNFLGNNSFPAFEGLVFKGVIEIILVQLQGESFLT